MYESHVTVVGIGDDEFKDACRTLGVKPVIIEDDTGSPHRQVMTARFHKTADRFVAEAEMLAVADHFGPAVIRRKLEKIVGKRGAVPEHLYLEFHLKYEVPEDAVGEFTRTVLGCGGHTARNAAAPGPPGVVHRFATARSEEAVRGLSDGLSGYVRIQSLMECVVFDDNPELDSGWSCSMECPIKEIPESIVL